MIRALVYFVFGFFALTVQSPLQYHWGFALVTADVPLILILHLSLYELAQQQIEPYRPLDIYTAAAVFALGYVSDVLGAEVKGVQLLSYGVLYLLTQQVGRGLAFDTPVSQSVVTFGASIFVSIVLMMVRWLVGIDPSWSIVPAVLFKAIITALVAPILLDVVRWFDRRLKPRPTMQSKIELEM